MLQVATAQGREGTHTFGIFWHPSVGEHESIVQGFASLQEILVLKHPEAGEHESRVQRLLSTHDKLMF